MLHASSETIYVEFEEHILFLYLGKNSCSSGEWTNEGECS